MQQIENDEGVDLVERMVPAFREGRSIGLKLIGVPGRSWLFLFGFQKGDIARSVNGTTLDSSERVMEVFSALDSTDYFAVEVERSEACFVVEICVQRGE